MSLERAAVIATAVLAGLGALYFAYQVGYVVWIVRHVF